MGNLQSDAEEKKAKDFTPSHVNPVPNILQKTFRNEIRPACLVRPTSGRQTGRAVLYLLNFISASDKVDFSGSSSRHANQRGTSASVPLQTRWRLTPLQLLLLEVSFFSENIGLSATTTATPASPACS